MPLASKILFALSLLSVLVTVVIIIVQSFRYKKEVKAYKIELGKVEREVARKLRLAKEAEVIRRFNELQRQKEEAEEQNNVQTQHYEAENH